MNRQIIVQFKQFIIWFIKIIVNHLQGSMMNFTDFMYCYTSKHPYWRGIIKLSINALASNFALATEISLFSFEHEVYKMLSYRVHLCFFEF